MLFGEMQGQARVCVHLTLEARVETFYVRHELGLSMLHLEYVNLLAYACRRPHRKRLLRIVWFLSFSGFFDCLGCIGCLDSLLELVVPFVLWVSLPLCSGYSQFVKCCHFPFSEMIVTRGFMNSFSLFLQSCCMCLLFFVHCFY